MTAVVMLPPNSWADRVENIRLGLMFGAVAWGVAALAVRAAACAAPLTRSRRPGPRYALYVAVAFAAAVGILYLLSIGLGMTFPILAGFVGVGLLFAVPVFTFNQVCGFSAKLTLIPTALALTVLLAEGMIVDSPPKLIEVPVGRTKAGEITFLSWNVGLGVPFGQGSRREHLDAIVKTITDSRADVVCLQELGGPDHLRLIIAQLGPEWSGVCSQDAPKATAVLSKFRGAYYAPRTDLVFGGPAVFELATPSGAVLFLSVHLRPGKAAEDRRNTIQWLVDYAQAHGGQFIVAGDFNADPRAMVEQIPSVFTDNAQMDKGTYALLADHWQDVGVSGPGTSLLSRRLDRIFIPKSMTHSAYAVLASRRQPWMDHDPVTVRIQLGDSKD